MGNFIQLNVISRPRQSVQDATINQDRCGPRPNKADDPGGDADKEMC